MCIQNLSLVDLEDYGNAIDHYQNEQEAGSKSLTQWRLGPFEGTGFNQSIDQSSKQQCRGSTIYC